MLKQNLTKLVTEHESSQVKSIVIQVQEQLDSTNVPAFTKSEK